MSDDVSRLIERLRVGSLTQERLDLAAYCGHAEARLAGGATPADLDDPILNEMDEASRRRVQEKYHSKLRWWCLGLRRFRSHAWACAISTALRITVEGRPDLAEARPWFDHVMAALNDWGRCPCPEHLAGVNEFVEGDFRVSPHVLFGQDAQKALVARSAAILFGPFDDPAKARHAAVFAASRGALVQLVEREADQVVLLHDAGPDEFTVHTRLASFCRAMSTGELASPTQPFLEAARVTSDPFVEQAVRQQLIELALSSS